MISLADKRIEPVSEVVSFLEHMLAQAKKGEIRSLAAVWDCPASISGSHRCGEINRVMAIGNLRVLCARIEDEVLASMTPVEVKGEE